MRILVDTNVLTRLVHQVHSHHTWAVSAVESLDAKGHELCIVPQVIYEFWVLSTRPVGSNGLGMTVAAAKAEIDRGRNLFPMLDDNSEVFKQWERLVVAHNVAGKPAHDARLVAAMRVHQITTLLTFNATDFSRYAGITVLSPMQVGRVP